ncbi:MAG: hypothetical protein HYS87_02225 [Candidatus Colwellbacteria bacterium]|nr:hypothetical protein [Candidatus Colwellbacteria bacterium]
MLAIPTRVIKIKPIVLTRFGEMLKKQSNGHSDDEELTLINVGIHIVCGGQMDVHIISETHNAVTCSRCALRVVFPRSVKTYGDLRNWLRGELNLE